MSKATGDGLLAAVFGGSRWSLAPVLRVDDGPAPYRPPAWTLLAAPVPDGYFATVALWDRAAADPVCARDGHSSAGFGYFQRFCSQRKSARGLEGRLLGAPREASP